MLLPYNVDVPLERWPYANWALIGLTLLVSAAVWAEPTAPGWDGQGPIQEAIERLPQSPPVPALALARDRFRPWQPFTYVLVHADLIHLAGNMLFLFCFGNAINARLGHPLFLAVYFGLGAISGLAWLGIASGTALIGASGAIMGLVGIFLVLYPLNEVRVFFWWFYFGSWEVASFWVILIYLAFDFLGTVTAPDDGVAYICHLAGAGSGMVVAVALVVSGFLKPLYHERNLLQVLGWQEEVQNRPRGPLPDLPVAGAGRRTRENGSGW